MVERSFRAVTLSNLLRGEDYFSVVAMLRQAVYTGVLRRIFWNCGE
jgi:hypothetical protein